MRDILVAMMASGLIWKLFFFAMMAWFFWTIKKSQKEITGSVDWLEVFKDPVKNNISYIRIAIMVALASSTYIYIIACTRTTTSVQEMINFTLAYLGVWVTGQVINKIADRPPAPVPQTIIQQPGGQVNQNNPPV